MLYTARSALPGRRLRSVTTAFQPATSRATLRWSVVAIGLPTVFAWLALWWIGTSPTGRWFRHTSLAGDRSLAVLVLVGWVVMTTAMMLPTTAPLIAVFRTVVGAHRRPGLLVAALMGGYLAVWSLVGAGAIVGDELLHRWIAAPRAGHTPWVMVAVLAGAAVYQFTPLKRRCVTACRSPFLFVTQRWHGGSAGWESFTLGVSHGWFCVGCCWTLMVVVFAVGMGNLGWMLAVSAVMALEKNVATLRWMGGLLGVVLFAAAVGVAIA